MRGWPWGLVVPPRPCALPRSRRCVPRYLFSNLSADIRGLYCESCEQLGIRWTRSNHRNISVAHRHSVAVLDSFIGEKR